MIGRLLERLRRAPARQPAAVDPISQYLAGGRIPWSPGYSKFKDQLLRKMLSNVALMRAFATGAPLPENYGRSIDERIVEIPWVLSRLRPGEGRVLDAGSVLNVPFLLREPPLQGRRLYVFSLELDYVELNSLISYIHDDFRERVFREGLFDTIVCISTLEHVGMWPIPKAPYAESLARPQPRKQLAAYREVLAEFFRLLAPGGQLLLTIPVGVKEDQDWLQIFSVADVLDMGSAFAGQLAALDFYRHSNEGWFKASAEDCTDARYYNMVKTPTPAADGAAAARAVACLELVRPPR